MGVEAGTKLVEAELVGEVGEEPGAEMAVRGEGRNAMVRDRLRIG